MKPAWWNIMYLSKSTKLYLQTQDMARKDGLTQIYNRVYFGQLFAAAAEEATKKQQPLSVALFDIDKFKNINDTYGHLAGDKSSRWWHPLTINLQGHMGDLPAGMEARNSCLYCRATMKRRHCRS